MKRISKVNWSWDYGKVRSELTYTDDKTEVRINEEKPPTTPSHDIAHFICGFHKEYEWDYMGDPVSAKVAEYNAVFMENLLVFYTHARVKKWPIYMVSSVLDNHMIWFTNEHYKFDISDLTLKKWFLKRIEPSVIIQHYPSFRDILMKEKELPEGSDVRDMKVSITMDSSVENEDEELYNYITEMKDFLRD